MIAWSAGPGALLNEVRSGDLRIASTAASNDFNSCSRNRMLPITFGNRLPRLGPKRMRDKSRISSLRALCVMAWATGLCACAPGSDPIGASVAAPIAPRAQTCRPDIALLAPQPAPDCGFGRANLKTLDPDQWTRLKLEYELKCYKDAEKTARNRLRLLQAACGVKSAQ